MTDLGVKGVHGDTAVTMESWAGFSLVGFFAVDELSM
jgi:hypothetical protein